MRSKVYKAAIFDMDGTILNTLDDLAASMNYVLEKTGHRHDFTAEDVRFFFGSGFRTAIIREWMLEKGSPAKKPDEALLIVGEGTDVPLSAGEAEEIDRICKMFREYYAEHCAEKTGPYKGTKELLLHLRNAGVATAVVSNKIHEAVGPLADKHFRGMFDMALGEKEGVRRKPAPDMINMVLTTLRIDPVDAMYIGDTEVDLATAKNAGIDCINITWGFRSRKYLEDSGAYTIVSTPEEVKRLILGL